MPPNDFGQRCHMIYFPTKEKLDSWLSMSERTWPSCSQLQVCIQPSDLPGCVPPAPVASLEQASRHPPELPTSKRGTGQTARRAMRHARPDSRQASTLAKLVSCRVWPAKISRPALRSPGNHTYSQRDGPAFNYCGGVKSIRITSKRRSPQIESQLVKTIRSIIRAKKGFSKSSEDSDRNYI